MAVTELADVWGRLVDAPEQDYAEIVAARLRACVLDPLPRPLWVKQAGIWAGRQGATTPTVRLAVYDVDGSWEPDDRYASFQSFQPGTEMADNEGGAKYEKNVEEVDSGPSSTALLLKRGFRPAIAVLSTGATLGISSRDTGGVRADNERWYDQDGVSQPPPAEFGTPDNIYTRGQMSVWLRGEWNEAPAVPVNRQPYDTIQTLEPTFEGDFRDNNGAWGDTNESGIDRGDKLKRVKMWLRRKDNGSPIWSETHTCDSAEQTANRFSIPYTGPTLTRGVELEWQCQVEDQAGAWSEKSSWLAVTLAPLGFVTLDGTPTGKQDVNTGLAFEGRWHHLNGLSTNAVQIRLYQGSTLVKESPIITKAVASAAMPGTLFSITWAESTFTDLAWGRDYRYSIRGRDTNGEWSDWSAKRSFWTDYAPTVPLIAPTPATVTTYPLIASTFSDQDDTTGTGLAVDLEITRPDGTVVVRPKTWNGVSERWEYQILNTDFTMDGQYLLRERSYDGTLYSGAKTVAANATWSAYRTITYTAGPVVTITSPTENEVVTTSSITPTYTVTWTAGGPASRFRYLLYDATGTDLLQTLGWITIDKDAPSATYQIGGGILRNGRTYKLIVEVEESGTLLIGQSDVRTFSVTYAVPATTGFAAVESYRYPGDSVDLAVRLLWGSDANEMRKRGYAVYRRRADEPDTADVPIAFVDAVGGGEPIDYVLIDDLPPLGVELTYSLSSLFESDEAGGAYAALVEGERHTSEITLDAGVVSLVSVTDGTKRIMLDSVQEMPDTGKLAERVYQPLGGGPPVTQRGPNPRHWTTTLKATLFDRTVDGGESAQAQYDRLIRLLEGDFGGGTYCYRNERGVRRFVTIGEPRLNPRRVQAWGVELPLREEAYTEAVVVTG